MTCAYGTVTVHDDKTKLLIRLQKFCQSLRVEFVITQIQRPIPSPNDISISLASNTLAVPFDSAHVRINRLMRFKIKRNLLLLPLIRQYRPHEQDQPIRWYPIVELESLLSGSDGGEDGESVDSGFDVRGGTVFGGQHGGELGDLGLWVEWKDEQGVSSS